MSLETNETDCYIKYIYMYINNKKIIQAGCKMRQKTVQKINNIRKTQIIKVKDILLPILGPGGQAQFKVKIQAINNVKLLFET